MRYFAWTRGGVGRSVRKMLVAWMGGTAGMVHLGGLLALVAPSPRASVTLLPSVSSQGYGLRHRARQFASPSGCDTAQRVMDAKQKRCSEKRQARKRPRSHDLPPTSSGHDFKFVLPYQVYYVPIHIKSQTFIVLLLIHVKTWETDRSATRLERSCTPLRITITASRGLFGTVISGPVAVKMCTQLGKITALSVNPTEKIVNATLTDVPIKNLADSTSPSVS